MQDNKFNGEVTEISSEDTNQAPLFHADVISEMERLGYSDRDVFGARLALEEALVNAIKHGNKLNPQGKVLVRALVTKKQVEIIITDEGAGFDPNKVPDPTTPDNLEKPSGRGIMLMRAYMDKVTYNKKGNEVTLVKTNSSLKSEEEEAVT